MKSTSNSPFYNYSRYYDIVDRRKSIAFAILDLDLESFTFHQLEKALEKRGVLLHALAIRKGLNNFIHHRVLEQIGNHRFRLIDGFRKNCMEAIY